MIDLELTIRKIKSCDKWLEFWIDGLPYDKRIKWDDKNQKTVITKEDTWNWSCKWYMFENAFKRSFPKKHFNEVFTQKGLDGFIGYRIINHKQEHLFKLKAPLKIKQL